MPLDLAFLHEDGPDDTPLVIAHGLLGSARNWGTLAKRFAQRRPVFAVDLRNHGDSPRAAEMRYEAMGEDLAAFIAAHCGGRAVLLGHSMGGKAAMSVADTHPELLAGLIVADMAPRAYDHNFDAQFAAMRAVDLAALTRRSEADAALKRRLDDPGMRAFILQNLAFRGGVWDWRPNLDAIEPALPHILTWTPPAQMRFAGPTLFLRGGASPYLRDEDAPGIKERFPNARIETIDGAGHWLHAEKPDAFFAAVEAFL